MYCYLSILHVDRSAYGDTSVHAQAYSGGGETRNIDTGMVLDLNWCICDIYIATDGTPYWYMDGVLVAEGEAAESQEKKDVAHRGGEP